MNVGLCSLEKIDRKPKIVSSTHWSSVTLDLDQMPLANQYFKIADAEYEFDLFELHHWLKKNYLVQQDNINL